MWKLLSKLNNLLKDCIAPRTCVGCGTRDTWLCYNCFVMLEPHWPILTLQLETVPLADGSGQAHPPHSSIQAVSAFTFEHALKPLIHDLKYHGVRELAAVCADLLAQVDQVHRWNIDLITFVPLHPQRKRERGFNQAQEIAYYYSKWLKVPCHELLVRTRSTQRQATTADKQERFENIAGAFSLNTSTPQLTGKNVLIIDDVITTGSTLCSCAQPVIAARATVCCLGVAHGKG